MEDVAEELLMDIDGRDNKNPLAVVEYINDLHNFYMKAEVSLLDLSFRVYYSREEESRISPS